MFTGVGNLANTTRSTTRRGSPHAPHSGAGGRRCGTNLFRTLRYPCEQTLHDRAFKELRVACQSSERFIEAPRCDRVQNFGER